MRLELTGRNVDITPGLRRLLDGKLARIERLLSDQALSAQAVFTRERDRHRVDITLHARGEKFLHGVGLSGSWQPAMTAAIAKIAQQAQKVKGKAAGAGRRGTIRTLTPGDAAGALAAGKPNPAPDTARRPSRLRMPSIVRTDNRPIKPMTLADAARELESGKDGLVVFRDRETQAISVLYRRRGELTLVKTEA